MITTAVENRTRSHHNRFAWILAIGLLFCGCACIQHTWAQSDADPLSTSETAAETESTLEFDPKRLVARIDATLEAMLYSEAAYLHPRTQMMLLALREAAEQGADGEQLIEIARQHQDRLPFSHFWIQAPRNTSQSPDASEPVIALTEPEEGVFLMRIDSFNNLQAEWVSESFKTLVEAEARGLIIDLRNNRGGTYSSGFVAAHLLETESSSGTLFARPVRQAILSGALDAFGFCAFRAFRLSPCAGRAWRILSCVFGKSYLVCPKILLCFDRMTTPL